MLRGARVVAQAASSTRAAVPAGRLARAPRAAPLSGAKEFLSGKDSTVLVRGLASKSLSTDRDPSKVGASFYAQPRAEAATSPGPSASAAPAAGGRLKVRHVLRASEPGQKVTIKGWVRSVRDQKAFSFIEVNDGSCLTNLQVVAVKEKLANYDEILEKLTTGASVCVTGEVVASTGKNQRVEIQAEAVEVVGECDAAAYPLQKKRHTLEFLRGIAHLRPRTNTISAVMRVRNTLAYAVHQYFQERGFVYVHTPIITASDCEGAGAMFGVTTLMNPDEKGNPAKYEKLPRTKEGTMDFSRDFFEKPAFLTVSGQLNAEMYACALSDVYTFGPTFRAENSNTARHLAEFWMIEPEMAFADLAADADCAEGFIKFAIGKVLKENAEDLALFDSFVEKGLIKRLERLVDRPFVRITYTEAIDLLKNRKLGEGEKPFEFPVEWGMDLQSEHERWLTETAFDSTPVVVMNYPKDIKAFYMRMNEDEKTVAAMDILVPKIGELVGGSQREEREDVLRRRLRECGLPEEEYGSYLDLRRFGSVPHAGFGVGFERLVLCATGMENIRDVIPFPRTPGNALF